jgi:hopene-associated glycosyltransferase HpnB
MFADCIAAVSLAIWIYLVFARGGFWRILMERRESGGKGPLDRVVAVIVPARNEANFIGRAVRSLVEQNYAGRFHVFVIDDASSDETAAVALRASEETGKTDRLTLVQASEPPSDWTGKLWAMSEGVRAASRFGADYFLFSDADIVHPPDEVARLIERAEAGSFDMVSLMVKLSCETPAERALIPAFVFFFFMLYPPVWVARRDQRTAAAAGGCILIRTAALERIGGLAAIRAEIIDDCALARAVKRSGGIWIGLAAETVSVRPYTSWSQIEQMISRTAFAQLNHSTVLLVGTIAGMAITYLTPPLLLVAGSWAAVLGGTAWFLMAFAFWPTLRFYRRSPLWAPVLPLIAAFYVVATLHSAIRYWQGRGGLWKGRTQDRSRA